MSWEILWLAAAFAGGVLTGLYWGGRYGRIRAARLCAERRLTPESLQRGVRELKTYYQAGDLPLPSDDDLRRQAEALLLGEPLR